ncbi:peptidoglycan-binding protein [Propionicimonas paludicola]|uniref:peptidoglycan-binding protein n=1 Tax=Propionicimonas paludicola TaxID=185243 RepID=UPI0014744E24|nr:peptidoglycan-binding protein [Propionicimonas paludicola]
MVSAAQSSQRAYGVPASVSIAQAIVNSDWGTSTLAKSANNFWDTRCTRSLTPSQFAALADAQVGKAYVLGAEALASNPNPSKFDCSELVQWLYSRSGNKITDLAAAQYNATKPVSGSPKVGDLVFLRNNPARSNGIGHVAILTGKLANGDWRIIEARGRAYGVVRTTLSYWKTRSYYAGLRRSSNFILAGTEGVVLAANSYSQQSGCISITSGGKTIRYSKYSSPTYSFAEHADQVVNSPDYAAARAVMDDKSAFIDALATIEEPKGAGDYAKKLRAVMAEYNLGDYDVVPFNLVLTSGKTGEKVTALQYLLKKAGVSVSVTGKFDSATVAAVKKFQSSKKLGADGEAGPKTFDALFGSVKSGASGDGVSAAKTLLTLVGYPVASGTKLAGDTATSVKAFRTAQGLSASGDVDANTWKKLFMSITPAPQPLLTGTPQVTKTLQADPGTWLSGASLRYQWYRNGAAISGATGTSYTLQPEDAGTVVTFAATGSKPAMTSVTRKASSPAVAKANLSTTPTPTITGTAKAGTSLTAVPGTWAPAPVTFGYQWLRDGKPISGATAATYQLQLSDIGAVIKVAVTGNKAGYNSVTKTSAGTAKVAVADLTTTPQPSITGTAKVGSTLTATAGAWAPAPVTLSYQWYRGNTAIKGATKSTYKLATEDSGKTIKVAVTGSKDGYKTVRVESAPLASVVKATFESAPAPTISGTAKVGSTLTATAGEWKPGGVTLSYQWYRGSSAIKGATKASYKVSGSDGGKSLTVVVTGTKSGYATTKVSSAPTEITLERLSATPKPKVDGIRGVNHLLKAKVGSWKPGGVTLKYRWYRNGTAITGATKTSYITSTADRGKTLTFKVTGSKSGYQTVSVTVSVKIK